MPTNIKKSVILIDDETLLLDGLQALLEQNGYSVIARADTEESAVEMATRLQPDLVIIDVRISEGSGTKATKIIRSTLPKVRIVACTEETTSVIINEMIYECGINAYVLKDEGWKELLAVITAIENTGLVLSRQARKIVSNPNAKMTLLTERESEVVKLRCQGKAPKEIAVELGIETRTVYAHLDSIKTKADIHDIIQLYPLAISVGLIPPPYY